MDALIQRAWDIIRTIGIGDVLDILIIAYAVYLLLSAVRKTSAWNVMQGVVVLVVVLALAQLLKMNVVSYLLGQLLQMGVVIIVVLFQPEFRRLLEQAGTSGFRFLRTRRNAIGEKEIAIEIIVAACLDMSKSRTGALIVFERELRLVDYAATGTQVNSDISGELLKSIFFPNTPLHDGAVLIQGGKIYAAGCMLPMSSNPALSRDLGMRHKAGIGISERCDAVSVIVSEETGAISVAVDGMLKRRLEPETFRTLLQKELLGDGSESQDSLRRKLRKSRREKKDKMAK